MSKLSPPPIREIITDKDGIFNRVWVQWFTDQFNRINERIEQIVDVISGNLPIADADGSLVDSGYDPSDFSAAIHTHESDDEGGKIDHGDALDGKGDDDHTQYLLADGSRDADSLNIGDGINYIEIKSDGEIVLHETARVTKYAWIPSQSLAAHGARAATWTTFANEITAAWEFADNADNAITYAMKIPDDMDFTEVSYICMGWSSPVLAGDCYWDSEYLITAVDDDTDGVATATNGALYESSGTADGMVKSIINTIAADTFDADSLCIHGAITRDISEDALGDVAHIHGIAFMYIANRLGDAT